MPKCACGETNKEKFSSPRKRRCIKCDKQYNYEYYRKKKKQAVIDRKRREIKLKTCTETPNATFSDHSAMIRFCQARRGHYGSLARYIGANCKDCSLPDKIENHGFVPFNFTINKRLATQYKR